MLPGSRFSTPLLRLIAGEEPQKQIKAIVNFLVIPIIFILFCITMWFFIAPKHKTKSGQVPTPDIVLESSSINFNFADREKQKAADFKLTGDKRLAAIAEVEAKIAELEVEGKHSKQK